MQYFQIKISNEKGEAKMEQKLAGADCEMDIPKEPMAKLEQIERSLQTTFKTNIWSLFMKAIYTYKLIEDGDHIAVAISGGKDSLLLAKLMQQLEQFQIFDIKVSFFAMDPGFNKANRKNLEQNIKALNIPAVIYADNIFERAEIAGKKYPCYLCARMRRGSLYNQATKMGANKLALGHHFDDVLETVMLNLLYGGKFETMLPTLPSDNFDIQLIRPLYLVEEQSIINFRDTHHIFAMNCGCTVAAGKVSSKRKEMKELIAAMQKVHPDVKKCIFSATSNVNLEKLLFSTEQTK